MATLRCSLTVIGFVLSAIVVSGCVNFRGSTLPRYQVGGLKLVSPPLVVRYDARVIMPIRMEFSRPFLDGRTQLMKESSRLFSQAGLRLTGDASTDLQLVATLYVYPDTEISFAQSYYFILSTWTCLILPVHEQNTWLLDVKVEQDGQLARQYRYRQVLHTWYQFFLLFSVPFSDGIKEVQQKAIDDLLFNFITDFQKDYAPALAKDNQPANLSP